MMRRRDRKFYELTYYLVLYIAHIVSTGKAQTHMAEKTSLESSKPKADPTKDPAISLQSSTQPRTVYTGKTYSRGSVSIFTQTPTPDNSASIEENIAISTSFSTSSTTSSSNSRETTHSSTTTHTTCEPAHQVDTADKRQIFETCENDTHCVENLTCEQISTGRKCYCSDGNQFFNDSCLRVNIPINSSCQEHFQCAFYGEETFCSSEGFCTAKMKERNNTCDEENRNLSYWISAVMWVFEGITCFFVGVICTTGILKHTHKSKRKRIKRNSKNGGSLCREYSLHGNKQQVPSSSIYCELSEEIILTSPDTNTQSNDEVVDDVYNHLHEAREDNLISDNVYGIPNSQGKKPFLEK